MATDAFGTTFEYWDSTLGVPAYVEVAEVHNISGPSVSRDSIETTHHGSTGGYREYLPGLRDGGEVTVDINWDNSEGSHADIYGQITSSQTANEDYRVNFSGGATFTFSGHVTAFDVTAPLDDRLTASLTIKLSGQPTLA